MPVVRLPIALVVLFLVGLLATTHTASVQAQQATTISMQDFKFVGLPARMQPGTYTWTVMNEGRQPHVLELFELLPGKTFQDVYAVFNGPPTQGPPTGLFAGDAAYAGLFAEPAKSFSSAITLHPGNYIAVCPIPDAASGRPHFALGMFQEVRVRADAPAAPVALPDTGATELTTLGLTLVALAGGGLLGGALLRRRARRV
jgi:hypothetical protein